MAARTAILAMLGVALFDCAARTPERGGGEAAVARDEESALVQRGHTKGAFGTGRILFIRRNAATLNWSHGGDLWILDASRGEQAQLTRGGDHQTPRWSPDGRQVVFEELTNRASGSRLFVIGADGSDLRPLTRQTQVIESWPAWSPDGRFIAFAAHAGGRRYDLFRIGADGSRLSRLSKSDEWDDAMPAWSGDGREIFFVSYRNAPNSETGKLYVMSATGEPARRMTPLPPEIGERDPRLSPDGRLLSFCTYRYDPSRHAIDPASSYVMNVDGSDLRDLNALLDEPLTSPGLVPFWSPDMKQMAFVTERGIVVTDARGAGRRIVVAAPDVRGDLAWSPDGRLIAFRRGWLVGRNLYVADATGQPILRLTSTGDVDGHMAGLEWREASGPMPPNAQPASIVEAREPEVTNEAPPPPPARTRRHCQADSDCELVEVTIDVSCAGAASCGWHAVLRGESPHSGCTGGPYPGHPCPPSPPRPERAVCSRGQCVIAGPRTAP